MNPQHTSVNKPRIIIIRHSERVDFVLKNTKWPSEVFINGVYSPNLIQLPKVLPIRANPDEYILDTPLSNYGKSHAYFTGEFLHSIGLIPNRVYTSPAMRCVQTADSLLDGLGIRDKKALRIDLGLFESTRKELPLQSANYFSTANFHVDLKYRPLLPSNNNHIIIGETRLEFYRRMYWMVRKIIRKVIKQNEKKSSSAPRTTLIVTHRSCVPLLAAMLNLDTIEDKFSYLNDIEINKRSEVKFLSMIIAEYDASTGLWTFLSDYPQMSINHSAIKHSE